MQIDRYHRDKIHVLNAQSEVKNLPSCMLQHLTRVGMSCLYFARFPVDLIRCVRECGASLLSLTSGGLRRHPWVQGLGTDNGGWMEDDIVVSNTNSPPFPSILNVTVVFNSSIASGKSTPQVKYNWKTPMWKHLGHGGHRRPSCGPRRGSLL